MALGLDGLGSNFLNDVGPNGRVGIVRLLDNPA